MDEVIDPVAHQRVNMVNKASRPNRASRSPPLSDQERHLSSTQAANPAGESCSPYANVWGRVDCTAL